MTSTEARIKRLEQKLTSQQTVNWNEQVPVEPERFYPLFGYFTHPATSQQVKELTDYQINTWKLFLEKRRLLEVKSNKIGESSKWLMVDFQLAILPSNNPLSCRGYDQLVIAQTKDHAKQHLRDLRKMLIDSPAYAKYLINKPDEIAEDPSKILKDEQSKTGVIYIHNPEKPSQPARIIALGIENAGVILSWKRVKHFHMSDVTAADGDYTPGIDAAMTRLANTNGTAIIETVPGPPKGAVYEMWQKYRAAPWKEGSFYVVEVTANQAVNAGVISQAFLDSEKERLGDRYPSYYEAQFHSGFGNVFKTADIERAIELGKQLTAKYGLLPKSHLYKSQGIDEGFGSSKFGVVVVQEVDNLLQVILAEEHDRPDIADEIYNAASRINTWPAQTTQCDAAQPAFIAGLKRKIGEDPHYELAEKEVHRWMKVKPIPFSTTHKEMLGNTAILLERGRLAIDPKFNELILSLRTAVAQDYSLDKDKTAHNDVLDALRLALKPYTVGSKVQAR